MTSTGSIQSAERHIHIHDATDLASFRTSVTTWLFGGSLPSEVGTLSSETSPIGGLTSLDTTEKITQVAYSAVPILWTPTTPNGEVIILHQGHTSGYTGHNMSGRVQQCLTAGYAVCGMVMPGGADTNTSGSTSDHNTDNDSLDEYIGPVIVAVNTLVDEGYSAIYMSGLSGGAWTTVLAAAVDVRIDRSYPIAGSLPEHMPSSTTSGGQRDWEQHLKARGCPVTYLDLYILGACGSGRRQKQINHIADSCCFKQSHYESQYPYGTIVANVASTLGGDFDLVWKTKATHEWDNTIFNDEVLSDLP